MKRFNISALFAGALLLALSSCLKEHETNVSTEDTTDNIATLAFVNHGSTLNSGFQAFSGGALTLSTTATEDTKVLSVRITGAERLKRDVTVTLAVDRSKLLDNYSSDSIDYELLPDSTYSIPSMTFTIPADSGSVQVPITFFPKKIDGSRSYGLPLYISDAGGYTIASNLSIVYLHTIGNPLAGTYNVTGLRYNYTGVTGYNGGAFPSGYTTNALPSPKIAVPINARVISMDFANLGGNGYSYQIGYNPTNPTMLTITRNSGLLNASSNFKIWVNTYNPATKTMHIVVSYNNAVDGNGNDRIIDETFVRR